LPFLTVRGSPFGARKRLQRKGGQGRFFFDSKRHETPYSKPDVQVMVWVSRYPTNAATVASGSESATIDGAENVKSTMKSRARYNRRMTPMEPWNQWWDPQQPVRTSNGSALCRPHQTIHCLPIALEHKVCSNKHGPRQHTCAA